MFVLQPYFHQYWRKSIHVYRSIHAICISHNSYHLLDIGSIRCCVSIKNKVNGSDLRHSYHPGFIIDNVSNRSIKLQIKNKIIQCRWCNWFCFLNLRWNHQYLEVCLQLPKLAVVVASTWLFHFWHLCERCPTLLSVVFLSKLASVSWRGISLFLYCLVSIKGIGIPLIC